jgi:hypothetical protein
MNKVKEIEAFVKAKSDLIKLKSELENRLTSVNHALESCDSGTKTEDSGSNDWIKAITRTKPVKVKSRRVRKNSKTGLTEFIKNLLKEKGPTTRKCIIEAVIASGVKTGKNVPASVSQVIYNKKHVNKLQDGFFSV